jgi:hypothetical protein
MFSIHKQLRIYDDEEGVYLQVEVNPDSPDNSIVIHTDGIKENEDWYGKQCLTLYTKEHIDAMIVALNEIKGCLK